jgi:hypothetical protein
MVSREKRQVLAKKALQLLADKLRGLYEHTTAYFTSLAGRCADRASTGFLDEEQQADPRSFECHHKKMLEMSHYLPNRNA